MAGISTPLVTEQVQRHSLFLRMALVALVSAGVTVGIVAWATDGFTSSSSSTPVRVAPATVPSSTSSVAPRQSAINDLSLAPESAPARSVAPRQSAINDLRQPPRHQP
jgi:hypothetical protein